MGELIQGKFGRQTDSDIQSVKPEVINDPLQFAVDAILIAEHFELYSGQYDPQEIHARMQTALSLLTPEDQERAINIATDHTTEILF